MNQIVQLIFSYLQLYSSKFGDLQLEGQNQHQDNKRTLRKLKSPPIFEINGNNKKNGFLFSLLDFTVLSNTFLVKIFDFSYQGQLAGLT